jgi:hypothetical protein
MRIDSPFQSLSGQEVRDCLGEGLEEYQLRGNNCLILEENLLPFLQGLDKRLPQPAEG